MIIIINNNLAKPIKDGRLRQMTHHEPVKQDVANDSLDELFFKLRNIEYVNGDGHWRPSPSRPSRLRNHRIAFGHAFRFYCQNRVFPDRTVCRDCGFHYRYPLFRVPVVQNPNVGRTRGEGCGQSKRLGDYGRLRETGNRRQESCFLSLRG